MPDDIPIDVGKVFQKYCAYKGDHHAMRVQTFRKLCRENDLLSETFTTEAAEVVFGQVKPKDERSINLREFLKALTLVAGKLSLDLQEVYRRVGDSAGPVHKNATKADAVRMHDDINTYTGVRAKIAHEQLGESSDEDPLEDEIVREKKTVTKLEQENRIREEEFRKQVKHDRELQLIRGSSDAAGSTCSGNPSTHPQYTFKEEPVNWSRVESVFTLYCGRNGQMEGSEFLKILKDCDLLDPRNFRLADVDHTFQKLAGRGHHSIGFAQFQEALNIIAEKKNRAPYFIEEALCSRQHCGPSINSNISVSRQGSEAPRKPGSPMSPLSQGAGRHAPAGVTRVGTVDRHQSQ